ncbi:hypothetical protein MCOR27_005529 [Pyricularia oryzae]|uniref:Uncharacterized protein n=2 Tax=Pyricularia TaxID=48558 RepID=A0ABQ8NLY4_PYRGI|nr:hypothetical protein MCOR02_001480 [Pyricularia oryzae]KAI6299049.1 hypothetical protein MCOR33_004916 [Pyricularia grisea]KAI6257285.1 hypothetical protein MCOR19_006288 [Pyricularia oryzae]KAI6278641.1 hypothetical protein MCOR27_005529 [Pyricularia oryzae]KAI6346006.1 hypothetical protein MCOR30_000720 [Pyricularia oryzae]
MQGAILLTVPEITLGKDTNLCRKKACTAFQLPAVKRTNVRPEEDFLGMQGLGQRDKSNEASRDLNGEREADSEANSAAPGGYQC